MRRDIPAALERVSERLPAMVIETLREQWARVAELDKEIGVIERRIKLWHRGNAASQQIAEIPGVGVLSATAVVAAMGDPAAFRRSRIADSCRDLLRRWRRRPLIRYRMPRPSLAEYPFSEFGAGCQEKAVQNRNPVRFPVGLFSFRETPRRRSSSMMPAYRPSSPARGRFFRSIIGSRTLHRRHGGNGFADIPFWSWRDLRT